MSELAALEEQAGLTAQAVCSINFVRCSCKTRRLQVNLDVHNRIEMLKKNGNSEVLRIVRPRAQRRASVGGKWTVEEDNHLKDIVSLHGAKGWKKVAGLLGATRTDVQCLHRWNKVLKVFVNNKYVMKFSA